MGNVECMYRECIGYCLERRVVMNSVRSFTRKEGGEEQWDPMLCALHSTWIRDNISVLQTFKTHSRNSQQKYK